MLLPEIKMSVFDHLKPATPSGISKVMKKFNADTSQTKIDLASGGKYSVDFLVITSI